MAPTTWTGQQRPSDYMSVALNPMVCSVADAVMSRLGRRVTVYQRYHHGEVCGLFGGLVVSENGDQLTVRGESGSMSATRSDVIRVE